MDTITITPKQLEILLLIYRFRFLNRSQLQILLKHKDTNRINIWLKDLTNKNIVGRHYSSKLKENTQPAIYYLMTKSKSQLLNQPGIDNRLLAKRVSREKIRSQKLINHCLLLADFYLDLLIHTKNENLHFFTKTDLSLHTYLPYHRPDAYIVRGSNTAKRYFLEIIDEGTPRFMIRKKIEQYIEFYRDQTWQTTTGHEFPTLLFLCPNPLLLEYTQKYLIQIMEEESLSEIHCYLSLSANIEWTDAFEDKEDAPDGE